MLRQTSVYTKGTHRQVVRCALGYAIATPEEILFCLEVEGPSQCWHLQPWNYGQPHRSEGQAS